MVPDGTKKAEAAKSHGGDKNTKGTIGTNSGNGSGTSKASGDPSKASGDPSKASNDAGKGGDGGNGADKTDDTTGNGHGQTDVPPSRSTK